MNLDLNLIFFTASLQIVCVDYPLVNELSIFFPELIDVLAVN